MLNIDIKILQNGNELPLPSYQTLLSAGMDLIAAVTTDVVLDCMDYQLIPTGISIAIPETYEAQIRPRSGLAAKHGITVLNSPGTIDADYRGEIKVCLINFGKAPFVITRGMRIAQIVVAKISRVTWQLKQDLQETIRNDGGFGSTGK